MVVKFLDLAGLVALWGKIKALIGNGALKVSSNSGTATTATTVNEKTDKTLLIKGDGTWISGAVSGSDGAAVVTLSHGNASTGSAMTTTPGTPGTYQPREEVTVVDGVTVSADTKGHITGVSTSRSTLKMPGDAGLTILTKVGNTETDIITYNANEDSDDGELTIVQGDNIVLTPDAANKKITIAAVATAPNNATLTVAGDTGSQQVFSADEGTNKTLTVEGGRDVGTTVTAVTGGVKVTVDHDVMNSTAGNIKSDPPSNTSSISNYQPNYALLLKVELTHTNGHITGITPTYRKIGTATLSQSGLMSAEDKKALDGMSQTIANALTSAITPKGGVTPTQLVNLVNPVEGTTILSAGNVGNLYQIINEESTDPNYNKPLVIGNTVTGDIQISYHTFVEGGSITKGGEVRHEVPFGSYVMVVNTGTNSNPDYKLDMVSGLYDFGGMSIPINTSSASYDGPDTTADPTIDSICV